MSATISLSFRPQPSQTFVHTMQLMQVLLNMGRVLDQSAQSNDTQALREAAVCWGEAWGLEPRLIEALFSKGYALHRVSFIIAVPCHLSGLLCALSMCELLVLFCSCSCSRQRRGCYPATLYGVSTLDIAGESFFLTVVAVLLLPLIFVILLLMPLFLLPQLGEADGACDCYARVTEAQPQHAKAWYNLGYLKAELDDQVNHSASRAFFPPYRHAMILCAKKCASSTSAAVRHATVVFVHYSTTASASRGIVMVGDKAHRLYTLHIFNGA